jgi:hypothetical protein
MGTWEIGTGLARANIDARSSARLEEVVGVGHDALQVFIAARAERWIMSAVTIKNGVGLNKNGGRLANGFCSSVWKLLICGATKLMK